MTKTEKPQKAPASNERFDSIQLMRGLAALLVVYVHTPFAVERFSVGSCGVDIFFVISGFIITHVTKDGHRDFLLKRAIRILPIYVLLTGLTFLLRNTLPLGILSDYRASPSSLFLSLTFTQNAYMGSPLIVAAWTLIIEIKFYVMFYIAVTVSVRRRKVYAALIVILMLICALPYNYGQIWLGSSLLPIEFIFGIFAYWFLNEAKRPAVPKALAFILAVASMLTLLYVDHYYFNGTARSLTYGIPALVFFVSVFEFFRGLRVPRFARFLGDISFSLYLTHALVIAFSGYLLKSVAPSMELSGVLVCILQIVLSVAVTIPIWYLIENRLTKWLRRKLMWKPIAKVTSHREGQG
ncbi:MAG: acyltransferase [Oscillospiraceae bacterium]|jgi:peptidoglycan/LPS O-acetylase OafA/YrhL|nr:acyltransferase [Oscillospiraceae bacterium]